MFFLERRPEKWTIKEKGTEKEIDGTQMCLADWFSLYEYVASGKPTRGSIPFEGKDGGYFKKRGKSLHRFE